MRSRASRLRIKMHQVLLVELIDMKLVKVSKIFQLLQIWLSPKNQNWKPILQKSIPKRIFLFLESQKLLYTYEKLLPRLQFLGILIQSVIFGLILIFGYTICGVLSQMTLDQHFFGYMTRKDLNSSKSEISQWQPIAFFSKKMIPTKTRYKTHNQELLAIVKVFKTWRHYLEHCKYKVFVLTDHNNLCQFMDTKNLSSY